jgi:hypothetical protein
MRSISKSKRHLEFVAHWRFWNSCLPNILVVPPGWDEIVESQLATLTYFTYMLTSLFGCMWSFCLVIWGLGSHAVNQKSMYSYEFGQLNTLFFSTCYQTISNWWFFFQPNTWGVSCSFGPPASKSMSPVQQPTSDKNCTKSHWHSSHISSY